VFDQTYKSTDYVPALAQPKLIGVGEGTIDGITTALMNMHIGDRWRVYIPQELGYRTTDNGSIPAFSTLIFDLSLMAYYRAGANIPEWK
jgi:FKBP-type peptidyl-prolyl cis-trans isomerase FklB